MDRLKGRTRILKNPAEQNCYEELTKQGWFVTKRGFPDFFCIKDSNIALVEVKPSKHYHLKLEQCLVSASLARLGVKCFKWTPETGIVPITFNDRDLSNRILKRLQKESNKENLERKRTE